MLLEAGVDVEVKNGSGDTATDAASFASHAQVRSFEAEKGAILTPSLFLKIEYSGGEPPRTGQ